MRGVNKVIIIGRLGRNPEMHSTANGHSYATLSVATNRSTRKGEEWIEIADWHNVRVWDRNAELCERSLQKGSPVAIEGQIRNERWENQAGEQRKRSYIHCERLHLLPDGRKAERLSPPLENLQKNDQSAQTSKQMSLS